METRLNPDLHHFISLVNGGFGTKLQKDRDTTRANHSAVLWRFFCRVNSPSDSMRSDWLQRCSLEAQLLS